MSSERMTLADGRLLGFRSLGDPGGKGVFFFYGTPGSRLLFSQRDPMARIPGIRLITPERPGYGISDPSPDRALLDWAHDVVQLADHLGIRTFAVAGESGGGPHALACAYALRDRVTMALLFGSPSPAGFRGATRGMSAANRLGLFLGRRAPWLVRRMMRGYPSMLARDPERFVDALARQMAPPDRVLLSTRAFRDAMIRDLREAYRQGSDGHLVDAALAMTNSDWGFDLRRITVPVHLWHGQEDRLVSARMARHLAAEIPTCQARFVPDAGHLLTDHAAVVEEVRRLLSAPSG